MFLLPIFGHGFVRGFSLFVIGHLFCGECLALMFIVNHVIEGAVFTTDSAKSSSDWAVIQCQTR